MSNQEKSGALTLMEEGKSLYLDDGQAELLLNLLEEYRDDLRKDYQAGSLCEFDYITLSHRPLELIAEINFMGSVQDVYTNVAIKNYDDNKKS